MEVSERSLQALRLHQFRVEARLTIAEAAKAFGITYDQLFKIEYRGAGRVNQIKRYIAMFEPGKRRLIERQAP